MKKTLSVFLALIFTIGCFTNVMASPRNISDNLNLVDNVTNLQQKFVVDGDLKGLKANDNVRINIELQENPLIYYANKMGKKLNKLDKETAKAALSKIKDSHENVKKAIGSKKIKITYHNEFHNTVNGLSGTTTLEEAKSIAQIAGVKRVAVVNEYDRPVPDMTNSKDLINVKPAWSELGYNGKGMVVAIIDTGIDPSHKDMVVTDANAVQLKESDINDAVTENNLPGTWRTAKVPYGYNYMDQNQTILDLGPDASRHGMHVAGIVGANGDETNGGIKGVAPEVQLLAMKVFGNNPAMPSTFGDVIVKAIDDSIALGADVINMSLGSTASFIDPEDLEQAAIARATENGVLCALSAGNSGYFATGLKRPYSQNPDIGVVGSPGLSTDSIQTASAQNKATLYENTIKAGSLANIIGYGKDSWTERGLSGDQELIAIGGTKLGNATDYDGIDVTGKVVLVKRGVLAFVDKTKIAASKGAKAIICYDAGAAGATLYKDQGTWEIPFMLVTLGSGSALEKYIADGGKTINVSTTKTYIDPLSGTMVAGSSWGTTPSLDFKPEITAPGGNILSTDQNNAYQFMSGTSMASPHVAGASALLMQRVAKDFGLTGKAQVAMAKNFLMSTAKPILDVGPNNSAYGIGAYASPRKQGAGMMDVYAAAASQAIIVDKQTQISKVNMKEIGDKYSYELVVKNFSDTEKTYQIKGSMSTDMAFNGNNLIESQPVMNVDPATGAISVPMSFSSADNKIIVPAHGETSFRVNIDLTNAIDWVYELPLNQIFTNGTFIEGFVQLEDANDADEIMDLNIPYMGFYGEWDKAPIIEGTVYGTNGRPFYNTTGMLDAATEEFLELDTVGSLAFSPNGDGTFDKVLPVLSFLRNAKDLEIAIYDENGKKVRDLYKENNIKKNYSTIYTMHSGWTWDGTINNKIAKDGKYNYVIKTRVDFENAKWQELTFPMRVDNTAPVMTGISYDKVKNILKVTANDGDYPLAKYVLVKEGKILLESPNGEFDLNKVTYDNNMTVYAVDMVNNMTGTKLQSIIKGDTNIAPTPTPTSTSTPAQPTPTSKVYVEPTGPVDGDKTEPTVMISTPEFFGVYNTSNITIKGTISDVSSLSKFQFNGQDVSYKFNTVTGVWDFSTQLNFSDGYHSINVEVADSASNSIAFAHKIFVDSTAPVINMIETPAEDTKLDAITLKALISDNLPSMKVIVNGNMLTNIAPDWAFFSDLKPAAYTLDYTVKLVDGKNKIVIEVIDEAGNKTMKVFEINKIKKKK